MTDAWRLLIDEPLDGAMNMAIDEAMMLALAEGVSTPTIRFFRWSPPCVSLGYFQRTLAEVDLNRCRQLGIGCVRRPTGGRAILHDAELTYSVVARLDTPAVSGTILESYQKISSALLLGLNRLNVRAAMNPPKPAGMRSGPAMRVGFDERPLTAACFDVPSDYEIAVDGRKLVGSAQTRQDGILLQHGSVLFGINAQQVFTVLLPPTGTTREAVATWLTRRVTSLGELLGRQVAFDEVAARLSEGFATGFGVRLEEGQLTPRERELASHLRRTKYAADEWTFKY